jgi:hypothetical protein
MAYFHETFSVSDLEPVVSEVRSWISDAGVTLLGSPKREAGARLFVKLGVTGLAWVASGQVPIEEHEYPYYNPAPVPGRPPVPLVLTKKISRSGTIGQECRSHKWAAVVPILLEPRGISGLETDREYAAELMAQLRIRYRKALDRRSALTDTGEFSFPVILEWLQEDIETARRAQDELILAAGDSAAGGGTSVIEDTAAGDRSARRTVRFTLSIGKRGIRWVVYGHVFSSKERSKYVSRKVVSGRHLPRQAVTRDIGPGSKLAGLAEIVAREISRAKVEEALAPKLDSRGFKLPSREELLQLLNAVMAKVVHIRKPHSYIWSYPRGIIRGQLWDYERAEEAMHGALIQIGVYPDRPWTFEVQAAMLDRKLEPGESLHERVRAQDVSHLTGLTNHPVEMVDGMVLYEFPKLVLYVRVGTIVDEVLEKIVKAIADSQFYFEGG